MLIFSTEYYYYLPDGTYRCQTHQPWTNVYTRPGIWNGYYWICDSFATASLSCFKQIGINNESMSRICTIPTRVIGVKPIGIYEDGTIICVDTNTKEVFRMDYAGHEKGTMFTPAYICDTFDGRYIYAGG